MTTWPMPDQQLSQDRSAWSARSYEGRGSPAKPSAACKSRPRWSRSLTCRLGYRRPDRRLQLVHRHDYGVLIPEDVETMVRIKVARLCKLRLLTSVDDRLTEPLRVSCLPIRASVAVRQINNEKT